MPSPLLPSKSLWVLSPASFLLPKIPRAPRVPLPSVHRGPCGFLAESGTRPQVVQQCPVSVWGTGGGAWVHVFPPVRANGWQQTAQSWSFGDHTEPLLGLLFLPVGQSGQDHRARSLSSSEDAPCSQALLGSPWLPPSSPRLLGGAVASVPQQTPFCLCLPHLGPLHCSAPSHGQGPRTSPEDPCQKPPLFVTQALIFVCFFQRGEQGSWFE